MQMDVDGETSGALGEMDDLVLHTFPLHPEACCTASIFAASLLCYNQVLAGIAN